MVLPFANRNMLTIIKEKMLNDEKMWNMHKIEVVTVLFEEWFLFLPEADLACFAPWASHTLRT